MRRVQWPNGSYATIFSDELPDQLRGYSGDTAWLDEFAKFKHPDECWDNLQFGMREASDDRPRRLITTTPRPIKVLKRLINLPGTRKVIGTSHENRMNLDPEWYQETVLEYANTRLGRQEVFAEILDDFPGALWSSSLLERHRVGGKPPRMDVTAWRLSWAERMKRIVIAMDPAAKSGETAAEHGIIVAGLGHDDHGYVLEDISVRGTPDQASRRAIHAYDLWRADRIVGEVNNGGDWIGTTVAQTAKAMCAEGSRPYPNVGYKAVHASRGKQTRAEPISALDEQGRIHHVGLFPELEDQMCSWDPKEPGPSPDRMDARVWALTELMLGSVVKQGTAQVKGLW
jgi:phage terminase large subunit-like protein